MGIGKPKDKTWLDVKLGITEDWTDVLSDHCYNVLGILESRVKFVLVELKNGKLIAQGFVLGDRACWIRMCCRKYLQLN